MLNHKSTRSARLFWLGALLGAAVFLLVYGLAPLDVANDAFCRGGYIEKDIQQHYAGWLFYRSSAPGWPLGVTQAVNAPQGVSVAYTDSIPLLAVLCRPLAAALGGTFQYFGWFTLVCFALQGGFAALLCGLFAEGLAAPLAGSLVFAASPILLERAFRHTSLGAQWLVLAALYCYFVCRRQSRFASRGLFVINILAVGIHPYFLPMTYAVTLALLLEYAVKQRQWLRPALFLGGNMLCTAALGWALGLLYGTATSGGQALYGYFAMNLNALWNPVGVNGVLYSRLLPAQNQVGGNYDAFAYLGLGVLALAAQFGLAGLAAKWWLGDVRAAGALRVSSLGLPWMAVSSVLRGFFIARRQVEPNVLSQLAEQTVRSNILLSEIVHQENLDVTEEEVEDELKKMAEQYKMELDKIKEMVDVEAVKSDLKGRKAVKLIVDNAKPVEKEKKTAKKAAKKEEAAEAPADEAKTEE